MHHYLLGLLAAQAADEQAAHRYADILERSRPPAGDSALARDLAAGVRADVARLRGDSVLARRLLAQVSERPTYQLVLPSPFEPRARERFLRDLLSGASRGSGAAATRAGTARSLYDLPYERGRVNHQH
jgi:hypothetical protein